MRVFVIIMSLTFLGSCRTGGPEPNVYRYLVRFETDAGLDFFEEYAEYDFSQLVGTVGTEFDEFIQIRLDVSPDYVLLDFANGDIDTLSYSWEPAHLEGLDTNPFLEEKVSILNFWYKNDIIYELRFSNRKQVLQQLLTNEIVIIIKKEPDWEELD